MSKVIHLDVELRATVRVEIHDDVSNDIFTRAETEEFQSSLYGDAVANREGVLEHWAYNAIVNNVDTASRLDGWADLERDAVRFAVVDANIEEAYER